MIPSSLRRSLRLAAGLTLALSTTPALAAVLTIDSDDGLLADAILDGVPFGAPNDGTPDAGANSLALALKSGVTEERVVLEIPLASLAGLTAADIASATLTINIDDVIGTFGPGFGFDGTAAESIFAWGWVGNGSLDLSDFNNVAGGPADSVVTGSHGAVTDATLAVSGPLQYDLDVTAALQSRLTAADAYLGVTLATNDDQSATSLDNLGAGGAGPAGVGGAVLPFLTIVTVEAAPPTFATDERKCQTALNKLASKYSATLHKQLGKCLDGILAKVGAGDDTAPAIAKCAAGLDPDPLAQSSATKARAKAVASILKSCAGLDPTSLNQPCDAAATNFTDVANCVLDAASGATQSTVRAAYADACAVLTEAGLDSDFVDVCTAP